MFVLRRRLLSSLIKTPSKPLQQASNAVGTWSEDQQPREAALTGPRFEQTDLTAQPAPMAAIELIKQVPIKIVHQRIVSCDGGHGDLGHPKVYINLDQGKPVACGYCGMRFQYEH